MPNNCDRCGEGYEPGLRYCSNCGLKLNGDNSSQQSAEEEIISDKLLGREIGGCIIKSKIGQGGMGAVYKGIQSSLNRPVAIKVLSDHLAKNGAYIKRFLRESEIVASIQHPNIVYVLDRGKLDNIYYFIMEFIEGQTVAEYVAANGPLTPGDALEIIKQSARALGAAAEENVIHRDIKPDNIMLDKRGNIKVTDFGLVKNTAETCVALTMPNQVMGTPSYMSPEQCQGYPTDHRSDIYSLGMTWYVLLSGRPAFMAETSIAIILKQISEPPEPVYLHNSNVPKLFWRVLEKMLAKTPEERFQNWISVIVALEKLGRAQPDICTPTGFLTTIKSKNAKTASNDIRTPAFEPGRLPDMGNCTLDMETPVKDSIFTARTLPDVNLENEAQEQQNEGNDRGAAPEGTRTSDRRKPDTNVGERRKSDRRRNDESR